MRVNTIGKIPKENCVWVLSTGFEFGYRASLWSSNASSEYISAPTIGKTGL